MKRNWILRIFVIAMALYAVITILGMQKDITAAQTEVDQLQQEIDRQNRENVILKEQIDSFGDDEFIKSVARKELGYVTAEEQIFIPTDK